MTTTRPHTNRDDVSELDRLREELQDGGYDGLYCTDERCGCGLDYLVACGEPINGDEGILEICKPAYKHTCIGEDCAYPCDGYRPEREGSCYGPSKNGPKRREREPNPLDRLREEYRTITEDSEDMFIAKDFVDRLIAALEAELERLRCCGNCEHSGKHGTYCDFPTVHERTLFGKPAPYNTYHTDATGPCHFTPSRWSRRGG